MVTFFYLFARSPALLTYKFSIDEPVSTNETTKESYKTTASPSPFSNSLSLLVEAAVGGDAVISILNPIGQQVHQSKTRLEKGGNSITVEGVENWPNGIYFLTVETGGYTYTEKVAKKN